MRFRDGDSRRSDGLNFKHLSQVKFSHRIDVSLDTIRNWEQGKRCPTGAAKALLKILDKVPESALPALR